MAQGLLVLQSLMKCRRRPIGSGLVRIPWLVLILLALAIASPMTTDNEGKERGSNATFYQNEIGSQFTGVPNSSLSGEGKGGGSAVDVWPFENPHDGPVDPGRSLIGSARFKSTIDSRSSRICRAPICLFP